MKRKAMARVTGASALAAITTISGLSAPALAADPAPGQLQVSVARVGNGASMLVDVNPDRQSGYWSFEVQELAKDGSWSTQCATWATEGSAETRTLPLGAGTYRVVVLPKEGWTGATSAPVTLIGVRAPGMPTGLTPATKPGGSAAATPIAGARTVAPPATVLVRATASRSKSHLVVDVDPNLGKRSWSFRVQVKRTNGTWVYLQKTYRTKGSAEIRKINLKAGTYRAVIFGDHGYRGATTAGVALVK